MIVGYRTRFGTKSRTFFNSRIYNMEHTLLHTLPDGTKIFRVDGPAVRRDQAQNDDFLLGGHGLVYSWIPQDEIWIEHLNPDDEYPILMHEITEYYLMKYRGFDYDTAHMVATGCETALRRKLPHADLIGVEAMLGIKFPT